MKFGTRKVYIILLGIREFHENRRRERRAFLMGVNQIGVFTCVPCNRMIFTT